MNIQKVQVMLNGMIEHSFPVKDGLLHEKKRFQFTVVQLKPGVYDVSTDGNPAVAVEGEIFIAAPMQTQTIRTTSKDKTFHAKRLFMNIEINNCGSIDFYYVFPVIPPENIKKTICDLMTQLFVTSDVFEKNIYCYRIAKALFSCAEQREQPLHPKLIQVLQYIRKHYHNRLTVGQIAADNQISASTLYSLFRQYIHNTPVTYLNQCKLDAAAQLLLTTDLIISEISAKVGFEDYSYFSKCFKRSFQVTPSRYRESRR